jgi:exonuclease III
VKGLPWCKDNLEDICVFLSKTYPDIICLQEVFTERARDFYKIFLEAIGYTVIIPNDRDVTWLPSGLLTAFKRRKFRLLDKLFCPYIDSHNLEWFALKGFHILHLETVESHRRFYLVNTHTQSDTIITILRSHDIRIIRQKQATQLIRHFQDTRETVLVVGDLNCEKEPNEGLRFLHPVGVGPLRKSTFFDTGEDLDHVACLVDRPLPKLGPVRVYEESMSDHAAVRFTVCLPTSK